MARILRVSCVLLLAGACGSDPPPSTDDTSTSTGTPDPGTSSGSDGGTTMAVTTMPPPDDTTYGAGCGPNPCAACPPGCESYDLCIASEWSCDCICEATGTTGPDACDSLDVALTLWLEESLNLPMDCGTVGEADDAAAWQAMHDCVVALAAGGSFRASWSTPSAAPAPWEFGAAGRFTTEHQLVWYELSGVFTLSERPCDQLVATPDCAVEVGQACLSCEGRGEGVVLCTDE